MRCGSSGIILLCVVGMLLLTTGCTRVKPWQRDALARQDMQFDPDPHRTALQGHIEFSKEASMPGATAGGGGCGCN
jgi:hypothetical protein